MTDHSHHHHAPGASTQCQHARNPAAGSQANLPPNTIYTCPMHPEIRQVGPGFCPICGMALEPVTAALDTGPSHELLDMTRRFWIGLGLTLGIVHAWGAEGRAPRGCPMHPNAASCDCAH